MHGLAEILYMNEEAVAQQSGGEGGYPTLKLAEDTPRRIIAIDVETGEWVVPVNISGVEAAIVAASVMPGMTPEMVHDFYQNWLKS